MADIGTAYVRIAPNMTGIQGKIASGMKGAGAQATNQLGNEVTSNSGPFQKALGKLGGIAKVGGLAIASGIAAGAVGIGTLATKMLMSSAQLEQALGGSEAVFGDYAKNVQSIAQNAYKNMGLSQQEFLDGANKMGSLYQGAGIDVQKSMELSSASIQRATDVASIMGIDTTTALESVTAMAKGNFTMMDNLGVAMNDTALNAYALEKGIGKTTQQMSTAEKVGLATQLFMEKTSKYAGNYAKENETLAGSINTTKKAFDDFLSGGGSIENFIDSIIDTIKIAVPQIVKILPKIVDGVGKVIPALGAAIAEALPALVPAIVNAAVSLFQAVVKLLPTVIQVLVQALPMFIQGFVQIFLGIVAALPQIVQILSDAIPQVVDAIVTSLTSPEALTAIIMGAIQLFIAILKAIPVIVEALAKAVPTIVKNIIKTITSPAFISGMFNAGVQLLQATISGIWRMLGSVGKAAWEIIKTIGNTLSPSNLWSIGTDLVKGLWHGIQSMGGWIKDKIIDFVKDKIPGPVKKVLGISSPSRLFAEYGKNTVQGMAQGINKNADMVSSAVNNMADKAIGAVANTPLSAEIAANAQISNNLTPGQSAAGGNQQSVTIGTIVLGDQSAVREFFKQLNQDTINVGMGITPVQGAH